jgi:hypothetical protein
MFPIHRPYLSMTISIATVLPGSIYVTKRKALLRRSKVSCFSYTSKTIVCLHSTKSRPSDVIEKVHLRN